MKEVKEKYIILSLIVIGVVILILTWINLSNTLRGTAKTILHENQEQVEVELDNFFEPVIAQVEISVGQAKRYEFDKMSLQEFNNHFLPIIKETKAVSSIMLAKASGEEFMILLLDSILINRKTSPINNSGKYEIIKYRWQVKDRNLTLIDSVLETKKYNPRSRPWFVGALKEKGNRYWTSVYTFFTTKDPGITLSKRWMDKDGQIHVIGFDLMITDISKMSSVFDVSENGSLFILDKDYRVLGLPKELEDIDDKTNVLKEVAEFDQTPMHFAYNEWSNLNKNQDYFPFEYQEEDWWCVVKPYRLGDQQFYIGITAPEKDFLSTIRDARFMIIGAMITLMLFFGFVIVSNQRKRKLNVLLKIQNEHIEEKNKEITDSIKYASKIQTAILPPDHLVKELLPESFILYLPKDIVAGDFYWIESFAKASAPDGVLFAAADCTGHGVPGAMVSVLCNNGLNRSVKEFGLTDPGEILDKTRELVTTEFEKSDREVKDGMDIALVNMQYSESDNSYQIKYAGANNPLWIIRKGTDEIEVTKPDKQPIANYTLEKPFTTHKTTAKKGDIIYVFSDGFADQFGGEKGKKLKSANMKKLFLSVKDKSMEEQLAAIHKFFKEWKGEMEQIDDVCVIAVKL